MVCCCVASLIALSLSLPRSQKEQEVEQCCHTAMEFGSRWQINISLLHVHSEFYLRNSKRRAYYNPGMSLQI